MKSVDYGHGTPGGTGGYLSAPLRENPPLRTNLPSFGGPRSEYAGIYGESGSFMGFGSPAVGAGVMGGGGMYMGTPVGLDPAAIFAAYQGGVCACVCVCVCVVCAVCISACTTMCTMLCVL